LSLRVSAGKEEKECGVVGQTLIFANVLEGKGQAGVSSLDDADLAKGAFADDSKKAEVIEVHCEGRSVRVCCRVGCQRGYSTLVGKDYRLSIGVAHGVWVVWVMLVM